MRGVGRVSFTQDSLSSAVTAALFQCDSLRISRNGRVKCCVMAAKVDT